jgi:transposase
MLMLPRLSALDESLSVGVYLCTAPTDMRKGFDSLAALVSQYLGRDPLSGDLFLFVSRSKDRIKALLWQPDGFALWYKRLEEGTYRLPAYPSGQTSVTLKASELAMLLDGIDLRSVRRVPRHRRTPGRQ